MKRFQAKRDAAALNSRLVRRPIQRMVWLFLLPTFAAFCIGFIYPFLKGAFLSFCKFKLTSKWTWVGFDNYLKAFADSRGICVLLVHHTRKSKNPEDSFDNINGSTGILGAADFTIVLDKQSRMDDEAGFLLTGRDIEQCERVIRFDKARCRWVMQGTAAQLAAQRRVAEYEAEPIVKTLRVLLQQGDGTWSGNAQALMQMGERYTNEELASSTRALAGRIKELQPMLWERDAIKCWDKQNGTGGKRYCFKMNRIDNTAPVMDSAQLSLRHNYR